MADKSSTLAFRVASPGVSRILTIDTETPSFWRADADADVPNVRWLCLLRTFIGRRSASGILSKQSFSLQTVVATSNGRSQRADKPVGGLLSGLLPLARRYAPMSRPASVVGSR